MGIRFRCHQCGHELHVKDFQGGKRSRCPECETKFRIPPESADYSIPLDNSQRTEATFVSNSQTAANSTSGGSATGTLPSQLVRSSSIETDAEVGTQDDAPQELDPVSDVTATDVATSDAANRDAANRDAANRDVVTTAAPRAIQEAPGATWYVRPPAGGQYGPAPANIFCEWLTESRVTRDSLVWRDGWPQWLVAGEAFADYFGPALPTNQAPAPAAYIPPTAPLVAPSLPMASPMTEQATAPEFVAPTTLSDRALAARKRQRKKNYMIMIGILSLISVGLVIALVVVLMKNS